MALMLRAISADELPFYARLPIPFQVDTVLVPVLQDGGLGGISLHEQPVSAPFTKDYDKGGEPLTWQRQFNLSAWHIVLAEEKGQVVGGAAVTREPALIHTLSKCDDIGSPWDIRLAPAWRGRGIGRALFAAAAAWARAKGKLQIETQNNNVPACRFYLHMGCQLGAIERYYYHGTGCDDETCLLWYLKL